MTITDRDREAGWAAMRAADHAHGLDAKAECYAQAIAQAREEVRTELDAERAAHNETKARLALAEAVCESLADHEDDAPEWRCPDCMKVLAAWRAAR